MTVVVVPDLGSKPDLKQSVLGQALCHASCVHTASVQVGCRRRANVVLFGL